MVEAGRGYDVKAEDKAKFAQLVTDVLAFYKQDASPFAVSIWWQACERYDFEQVSKALTAHALDPERGQFAPKPADLVRILQGTKTDRARLAWSKVMDSMQRVGAYQSVVFDDPIIHAVIEDLGGWGKCCRSDMEQISYLEHRFCDAYKAYANRPGSLNFPAKLMGEHEQQNAITGKRSAPPILIGNATKAAEVLRIGGDGSKTTFTDAASVMPLLGLEDSQA